MRKMFIYVIENTVNSDVYVGKTVNLKVCWKAHKGCARRGDDRHLYRAMRAYGIERFTIRPVLETLHEDSIFELEKVYIKQLQSEGVKLYNHDSGGGGMPQLPSEKTCVKIKQILKEKWSDPELRAQQSARMLTIMQDEAIRKKIGKKGTAHPRSKLTEEQVRQIKNEHTVHGVGCAELGRRFHVKRQVIWRILNGLAWTHVQ